MSGYGTPVKSINDGGRADTPRPAEPTLQLSEDSPDGTRSPETTQTSASKHTTPATPSRRLKRFHSVMDADCISKPSLADLAWSGVPLGTSRSQIWQILLDYRPLARESRERELQSRRQQYHELRHKLYEDHAVASLPSKETARSQLSQIELLLRQIRKDLPRTQARFDGAADDLCTEKLVRHPRVQALMERVLFTWQLQQSASGGYVQGIDGILLLLILVSLADLDDCSPGAINVELLDRVGDEELGVIEADSFWCLTKILDMMYDHHAEGFPGIQRMATRLMELVWRIDAPLAGHLDAQGIDILEMALRWIGCLMVRELPVSACARLWDALIAESSQSCEGFESLLLYFCVCFMAQFGVQLQKMDFEAITMFMKKTSLDGAGEDKVEVLLGEAFVLKNLFQQAPNHLNRQDSVRLRC